MDFSHYRGLTARLQLRPYRNDDFDAFHDLHSRDDVARYLPWETRDESASRKALDRHQTVRLEGDDDGMTLAAFDVESGRLVGEFVLFLRSRQHRGGEVGYVLHPQFWRQGLATEGANAMLEIAFDTLDLHRVIARIDARNVGSAAVLERLGMRREAVLVDNEWFKGEWSTEADYAILQDEWVSRGTRSLISSNTTAPAPASASEDESPPPKP